MQIQSGVKNDALYIKLIGEMDEYSAAAVRRKCDDIIDKSPKISKIIINLSDVAFMDSTGIGFLIGRYKKAARAGLSLMVQSPNLAADKILNLSGIYTLIPKAE